MVGGFGRSDAKIDVAPPPEETRTSLSRKEEATTIATKLESDSPGGATSKAVPAQQRSSATALRCHSTVRASPRLAMSFLFLFGSIWFYPSVSNYDFTVGASLFAAGSALFLVAVAQDAVPMAVELHRQRRQEVDDASRSETFSRNVAAMAPLVNTCLYGISAASFLVGSLYFLPDLYSENDQLGCVMFVVGTTITLLAVAWDTSRLLLVGTRATIAHILALLAAAAGADLFLIGTLFSFPMYLVDDSALSKGASFFTAGSCCFIVHSLSIVEVTANALGGKEEAAAIAEEEDIVVRRKQLLGFMNEGSTMTVMSSRRRDTL